jgi:hypothetical protein
MKTGNGSILFLKRGYIESMMDSGHFMSQPLVNDRNEQEIRGAFLGI